MVADVKKVKLTYEDLETGKTISAEEEVPQEKIEQGKIKATQDTRAFRRHRKKEYICVACQQTVRFAWACSCGFAMCQECMQENLWGMTCNNITWACPDCGKVNGFGNQ